MSNKNHWGKQIAMFNVLDVIQIFINHMARLTSIITTGNDILLIEDL